MNKWKIVFKDDKEIVIETGTWTLGAEFNPSIRGMVLSAYDIFSCDYNLVKYYIKLDAPK